MYFKAKLTDPGSVEPPLHHFECSLFLRQEQNTLAARERIRNDVRDRLRFSCTRRSLNDEVCAAHYVDERAMLRSVGIMDQVRRNLLDFRIIDWIVVRN